MEKSKATIDMGQPVKLGQFILALIGILITVSGMIYAKGSEDATTLKRIEFLEKEFQEYKTQANTRDERNTQKMEKIDDKVNQILIILQNKQDRKQ